MKKRRSLVGGVVNKTPDKNNFQSIIDMLNQLNCKVDVVSYQSLSGFIFKVEIDRTHPENAEFYGLNEETGVFDIPVTTLILKLVILHNGLKNKSMLPAYRDKYRKQMSTTDEFEKEANTQYVIYKKTLEKGSPICPAIIGLYQFNREQSSVFLDVLIEKCGTNQTPIDMVAYIRSNLTGTSDVRELGMIAMESASDFSTFYKLRDTFTRITEELKLCADVMVQIIRLFDECNIVHLDLHGNNVLIGPSPTQKIYIIDFGRTTDVNAVSQATTIIATRLAKQTPIIESRIFDDLRNYREIVLINEQINRIISYEMARYHESTQPHYIFTNYMEVILIMADRNRIDSAPIKGLGLTPSQLRQYFAEKRKWDAFVKMVHENYYGQIASALNKYKSSKILCDTQKSKYKMEVNTHDTICNELARLTAQPPKIMNADLPSRTSRASSAPSRQSKSKSKSKSRSSRSSQSAASIWRTVDSVSSKNKSRKSRGSGEP